MSMFVQAKDYYRILEPDSEIEQLKADAELGRLVRMMPHNIGFVRYGNGFCILQRSLQNPGNTFDRETRFNGATPEEALQKFYKEQEGKK